MGPVSTRVRSLEAFGVFVAPLVAFFALRLQAMAPVGLPDPSMHTTFLLQPRDIFLRYQAAFTPTSRLREGARVGFLVPARLADLLFGAVPGFFFTRYVLALVATIPVYLLFRRLHGVSAGALGVAVFLTCPVVITAWGTDYPDGAVISYIAGASACLAIALLGRRRRAWLAGAATLLTFAVWAHGMGALVALIVMACFVVVRVRRQPSGLLRDLLVMAVTAATVTALLALGSAVLLGEANFITPTWRAFGYLSRPDQLLQWHSTSWRWAPYVTYVLVPPAVLAGAVVVFFGRLGRLSTPAMFLVATFGVEVLVFFYEQFVGNLQTLEQHYFSSTLWAALGITLVVVLSELGAPLGRTGWRAWITCLIVVIVVFAYELDPHVPAFGWLPYGVVAAAVVVVAAGGARFLGSLPASWRRDLALALAIALFVGAGLVLSVAPMPRHRPLPHTVTDPPSGYAAALGGNAVEALDMYRVSARLVSFVGPSTYPGEQVMMWVPLDESGLLIEPIGMYHAGFDLLDATPPILSSAAAQQIAQRRPAEILVISLKWNSFRGALDALRRYRPRLVRSRVLAQGDVSVYVWLVDLQRFMR